MSDNVTETLTVSKLIDDKQLAEWLGISPATPANWRHSQIENQPPYKRIGSRTIRYSPADVNAWLDSQSKAGASK